MIALKILAICFIIYEIIRLFNPLKTWNELLNQWQYLKDNLQIKFKKSNLISYCYILFFIILMFTQYWYLTLCMLFLSCLTSFLLFPFIKYNVQFNSTIKTTLIIDSLISILILLILLW